MRIDIRRPIGVIIMLANLAATAPAPVAAPVTPPQPRARTLKVAFHIPAKVDRKPLAFEVSNGILVFRAKVGGQMVWAALDNGADISLLDRQLVADQKIAVGEIVSPLKTSNGPIERRVAPSVAVELPGQVSITAPFSVIDLGYVSMAAGRPISLVVGREYFGIFVFVILPGSRTFQLGPSGSLRIAPTVPFTTIEDGRGRVQVDIGGERFSMLIDLGATTQLVFGPEAWARLRIDKASERTAWSASANGRHVEVAVAKVARATIGPFAMNDVTVTRRPNILNKADGLVGLGFLRNFNFAIDVKGGKMWMLGPVKKAPLATSAP